MTYPFDQQDQTSLRDLAARVIDNTKDYLRAEVTLVKQTVATKAGLAGPAAAMVVVAIILLQAAVTILAAALGLLLARWLGMAGGFAIAALITIAIAGMLVMIAMRRLKEALK